MIRAALILTVVGSVAVMSAQPPSAQGIPAFEVASVKPNKSGDFG